MLEIKCPNNWSKEVWKLPSLFLGGGITNCPQWQPIMVELLKDTNFIIFNPRRDEFDISKKNIQLEQIEWEYKYLKIATARLFWFPKETLCPITLFELGKFCEKDEPLFVGCDPDYARKDDIEIQLNLARGEFKVHYSLNDLAKEVKKYEK
jgi:hypothetical protein